MDRPFVLYLIRHLETAANRERRYVGWTNVPVSASAGPAPFCPDVVWGSDLLRCRQTAALLFPGRDFYPASDFRECHFGDWEMKSYDELKEDVRYRSWIDDPASVRPPGGETFGEMAARADRGLSELRALSGIGSAAVVSHGGPLRHILMRLAPEEKPFFDWRVPAGSVHELQWNSRKDWEEGARCTFISAAPITENGTL
ncbi:histidine phosphatase family protein [Bhargavaea ullalensis]|uniref:Alpha-ribazole phosphatase n=1 Tax=Bhargavaea ullalensis TaxID=1265685 RepID=A0ABV2GBT3_9BACL